MRNNFAPINRTPGAILSLIPSYWDKCDLDSNLVTLTHVCRHLRAIFISYPWLWTRLDFTNVGRTRAYVKRSKSLPLKAVLSSTDDKPYLQDAFLPAVPHIGRFKSLTINGTSDLLRGLGKRLTPPAPLLEELKINITYSPPPCPQQHAFRREPLIIAYVMLGRGYHESTLEEYAEPHHPRTPLGPMH